MKIRLSHYGWMVARHLARTGQLHLGTSPENDVLLDLWTGSSAPFVHSTLHNSMVAERLIEVVADESIGDEEISLLYRRNPFEHVEKVIFEFTTYCNFNCDHCYNAQVPRVTEKEPQLLVDAADTFIRMGIHRFDFIGGEVSHFGNGWLEVVDHIRSRGEDIAISLFTNGWWLEQRNIQAAGQFFIDDHVYIEELKRRGVTYVTFSLDGPGVEHDRSRHHPGLYEKILRGLAKVQQAGLSPRVSLLIRPQWSDEQTISFLAKIASAIYEFDSRTPAEKRALRLYLDPTNSLSNFIDIGNGALDKKIQFPILDERKHALYCRNFYRLSPSLTIKANGQLATCRLSQVGEGYGNIHETPLVEIINHFDKAYIYRLHNSRDLEKYLPLLDRSLFGSAFTHLCSLRGIVTLLARKMHEQGISLGDLDAVQRINREVSMVTGHLQISSTG